MILRFASRRFSYYKRLPPSRHPLLWFSSHPPLRKKKQEILLLWKYQYKKSEGFKRRPVHVEKMVLSLRWWSKWSFPSRSILCITRCIYLYFPFTTSGIHRSVLYLIYNHGGFCPCMISRSKYNLEKERISVLLHFSSFRRRSRHVSSRCRFFSQTRNGKPAPEMRTVLLGENEEEKRMICLRVHS